MVIHMNFTCLSVNNGWQMFIPCSAECTGEQGILLNAIWNYFEVDFEFFWWKLSNVFDIMTSAHRGFPNEHKALPL